MNRPKPTRLTLTAPAVRLIDPHAVFRLAELQQLLGLPVSTLKREARQGRLRVSRRAGMLWTTGAWVHQWIAGGEVKRPAAAASDNGHP
jgi:hypothetical protein